MKSVGIELLPPTRAGGYHVQPIAIDGEAGVDALEKWLEENSFVTPKREVLEYYSERSWTFLAIKIDATGDGITSGALAPLVIDYEYDVAVFPLKIMAGQGVFPVRLYVIGAKPLTIAELGAASSAGFEVASGFGIPYVPSAKRKQRADRLSQEISMFTPEQAPSSVRALFQGTDIGLGDSVRVRVLYQKRLDAGVAALGALAEDLSVPALPGKLEGKIDRSISPTDKVSPRTQPVADPAPTPEPSAKPPATLPTPPAQAVERPPTSDELSGAKPDDAKTPWWLLGAVAAVAAIIAGVVTTKRKSEDI